MTHAHGVDEPGGADEIAAARDARDEADAEVRALGDRVLDDRVLDDEATLRRAREGDEAGILACIQALADYEREPDAVENTEADLRATLFGPDPRAFAHVVEREGRIVGIALWFLTYSTWTGRHGIWLEDLYVDDTQRGRGYGRALISALARECIARGYPRLEWTVLDWNEPAIGFYRSIGASAMDEWTTQRMSGSALSALAAGA